MSLNSLARAVLTQKVEEARERADALSAREQDELLKRQQFVASAVLDDALGDRSLKDIMAGFVGQFVFVNYKAPTKFEEILLAAAQLDTFTLADTSGTRVYLPYRVVLSLA